MLEKFVGLLTYRFTYDKLELFYKIEEAGIYGRYEEKRNEG